MDNSKSPSTFSNFIVAAGVILAVSYPVLAISTGFRAVFQIFEAEPSNSPWLTLVGALCYTVATIGFAKQPREATKNRPKRTPRTPFGRWYQALTPQAAWRISAGVLIFETALTILVGTLSYTAPEIFGRNLWEFFGRDYGYFPLVQPLLGILWLFNSITLANYGIRARASKA